jgi:ribosomal protein S27AE
MTESVQFASMNCPGCGAGLQVTTAMDFFACGYCGMSIRAVRQGGTVALVAEALARIKTGTDKTAAELALVRLKDELKTINLAVEQLKLAEPQVFIPEKKSTMVASRYCQIDLVGDLVSGRIGGVFCVWFIG